MIETPAGLLVPDSAHDAVGAVLAEDIYHIDREFPADWMRRLREFSPVTDVVSWLHPKWSRHSQRWRLYDCVPARFITDDELIKDLEGPDPESIEGQRLGLDASVTLFQQQMWKQYKVHARDFWCIQGTKGGHPVIYSESTKELCRAYGLPTEPPAPGSQSYAPFDERVIAALAKYNRLIRYRNDMGEFKRRYGSATNWRREKREELRAARAEFVRMLNETVMDGDDLLRSAVRKGEADDVPVNDTDWVKENEEFDERYINKAR